ncbi:MAG: mevalonate kinase, partial [Candidatus Levybacteria bacterium]|nr:mevalonate kinase [Candidatus Levybacteria bacterium]
LPLVIGYSEIKADTVSLIEKVAEKAKRETDVVENIYNIMEKIVRLARPRLAESNWQKLGALMNENQTLLQSLGVSTEKLDAMINAANNADAYGSKLSGAGGGDCMIALAANSTKQTVQRAIEKVGGEIIEVETNVGGVRVEKS